MKKIVGGIKNKLTILMSIMALIAVVLGTGNDVMAAVVRDAEVKTIMQVSNYKKAANIGGISVGTANDWLFVVKTFSKDERVEEIGALYYYSDLNKKKKPKTIKFENGLLGHANAMAIDDHNIYVTMWQNNGPEKVSILKISRAAISNLENEETVKSTKQKDSKGNVICKKIIPYYSNGKKYDIPITAITRFVYDKANNKIQFIINKVNSKDGTRWGYRLATLNTKNDSFIVSTLEKDSFSVNNTMAPKWTGQDIFYRAEYGFFIPLWNKENKIKNQILVVDINRMKSNHNTALTFDVKRVINVNGDEEKYNLYEIESIAYVKNSGKLIFSCNAKDKNDVGCDRIEKIINTQKLFN